MKLTKFIPFAKVDEAKREVWGIVTAEVADKEGETCRYEPTKENYKVWSAEFQKATDGGSLGNLREMHQLKAAGKGVGIEFHDDDKEIWMGFKVVDDAAWQKVIEKVYTGFSQGGEYVDGPDSEGFYTAKPSEVSLVDNPCLGVAHFAFIRSTGAVEMIKIRSVGDVVKQAREAAALAAAAALAIGSDMDLTKKAATIHAHLTKAMEHHEKMGGALADCMKAMGHEPDEDDMDTQKARKAATDAGLSGAALETFLTKFTAEPKPEPKAEEPTEAQIRKTAESGGLTGAALDEFVRKATGKPELITKADVASIVGQAIAEAFKAVFTKPEGAQPKQTSVPVTKAEDTGDGKKPETVDLSKLSPEDRALAIMKATPGEMLTADEAMHRGITR